MTEEKLGNASKITGFAVKFWNIKFPPKITYVSDWAHVQFMGKWQPGWKRKCGSSL